MMNANNKNGLDNEILFHLIQHLFIFLHVVNKNGSNTKKSLILFSSTFRVPGPYFGHDLTSDIVIISPCFH